MKILNKLLIVTSVLCCIFPVFTYAADDCNGLGYYSKEGQNGFDVVNNSREINNTHLSNFLSIEQQRAIIRKDDLNTAMLNLKKYCCKQESMQNLEICTKDKKFFNDNSSLDSPYLFDHLFDVIMRRLNGLGGDKYIYTNTKMSLDTKGEEWRNRITEQAESTKGSTPQTIHDKYNQLWTGSSPEKGFNIASDIYAAFGDKNDEEFLNYIKSTPNIANALKNYKEWSLYDRYSNACALSEYFYVLLRGDVGRSMKGGEASAKTETINKIAGGMCDNIVKRQIDGENEYVQIVARKSSNLFLLNYLEGYISYLNGRQETLQKLWKDTTDRFLDVARAVPCLQKVCQK